ncbi:MAG: MarR family winged helix-turn-helix transcriptional regulator [Parvibaculales bacterium]|jgi:DNA-binding MarR family transcriptional regulator|nr:MarR family transcriptional regulator [bacterium]
MSQRTDDALIAMRQISRATASDSRALAKASALSVSQLIALQEINRARAISPSKLALKMSLSRGTMTSLMNKLEARNLVQRQADTIDKRRWYFSLTPTGQTMIEQAPRMLHEQFSEKFGQLQQWEQAQIISALERIVSMLDAEDIDAAPILDTQEIS